MTDENDALNGAFVSVGFLFRHRSIKSYQTYLTSFHSKSKFSFIKQRNKKFDDFGMGSYSI